MKRVQSRLLIVDQSLKGPGGHHFECAFQIAKGAIERGYAVTLGTHRKFSDHQVFWEGLPPESQSQWSRSPISSPRSTPPCEIFPCFNLTTYSRWTDLEGLRSPVAGKVGWSKRVKDWLRHQDALKRSLVDERVDSHLHEFTTHLTSPQKQVVRIFGRDMARFLTLAKATADDVVFVSTISELEFLALGLVAEWYPEICPGRWHVQFHYNVFSGRPHEYEHQRQRLEYRRAGQSFQRGFKGLSRVKVSCYTTSKELADQYNDFSVGLFEALPYPVNPKFMMRKASAASVDRSPVTRTPPRPLRITMAGGLRREKGQQQLRGVIEGISETLLESGQAKLVLQGGSSRRKRAQLELNGRSGNLKPRDQQPAWLEYVGHPLSEQAYVDLIKQADIGLLIYDSRTYYARRAGVLGEFFASGVPVVVPAACWLAEQVASANQPYWRGLYDQGKAARSTVSPESRGRVREVTPGLGTEAVIVRGVVEAPVEPWKHLTLGWQSLVGASAGSECPLNRWSTTIDEEGEFWCLLPVLEAWRTIPRRLSLRWSFSDAPVRVKELGVREVVPQTSLSLPWGKVGLVATDIEQVPELLKHMVSVYPQFKAAAREYAFEWFADHKPAKTLSRLLPPRRPIVPVRHARHAA